LDTTTRPARLASNVAIAQVFRRAELFGEGPHPFRGGRESARLPHQPALPHRDLRELPMHIQPDTPPLTHDELRL
jgi:hypothetical protein